MNTYQRAFHIDRLAEEVGFVDQNFERFGGLFLNLVLDVPVEPQGINVRGYPVAGVVDGLSADGTVAAEYSARKKYFDSPMTKARDDLAHVLENAPSATTIYLISSLRKRPQIAQGFEVEVAGWPEMSNRTLHLLGAEEIATAIIDKGLWNDDTVRQLAVYLPTLQRLADEEAAEGLVPAPDPRRIARPDIDAELARRLDEDKCIVIGGLSGIGKSDAAASFASQRRDLYQNIIWLEGNGITRVEDLRAIKLTKMGELRNVAGLLATRRCLLVIDDAHEALSTTELSALCGPQSRVLLTRKRISDNYYEIPMLDQASSRLLLDRDVESCPSDVFQAVWSTVGGHPLSLGMMNAAVAEGATWGEIEQDCSGFGRFETDGQILADRLLARLSRSLRDELSIFEWAGQARCDRGFLVAASSPSGLRKLKTHGLTAADRPRVVRLHDVVFASLKAQDWWTTDQHALLTDKLDKYLAETAQDTDLIFWSAAGNLRHVIRRIVAAGEKRPAFIYALLSVWSPSEIEPALVGDPVLAAAMLKAAGIAAAPIATMATIETVEQLYLRDKLTGYDFAKDQLKKRMVVFDDLACIPDLTIKQRSEIKHHTAKALSRLGHTNEAVGLFEEILRGACPLPESTIQLMRLLRKGDEVARTKASDMADQILSAPERDGVSHSVFLAAVEQLPWRSNGELIFKHSLAIENRVVDAANLGIPQAFRTLASIARYLSKEAPELLRRILSKLPQRALSGEDAPEDRATWGDILLEASRTAGDAAQAMQAEALLFFEGELAPKPFHQQRHAELLLLMGRAREAKSMLLARDDLLNAPFPQRLMALVELRLENPVDALIWIDRALAHLKTERFRAEFYEHRYDIRKGLNDSAAIDDLHIAIEHSEPGQQQLNLNNRLIAHTRGMP